MPRNSFEDQAALLSPADEDVEKVYDPRLPLPRRKLGLFFILSLVLNVVLLGYTLFSYPAVQARLSLLSNAATAQSIEWRGQQPGYCKSVSHDSDDTVRERLSSYPSPSDSARTRRDHTHHQSQRNLHYGVQI